MPRFLGIIPMRGVAKITNSRLFKKKALKAFHECDKVCKHDADAGAARWS
jgi:hypothetical protein